MAVKNPSSGSGGGKKTVVCPLSGQRYCGGTEGSAMVTKPLHASALVMSEKVPSITILPSPQLPFEHMPQGRVTISRSMNSPGARMTSFSMFGIAGSRGLTGSCKQSPPSSSPKAIGKLSPATGSEIE